jgi:integrase
VAWIKTNVKRNELSEPNVLTEEEGRKLIEAVSKPRDKAFVAVLFEGGFRISEMHGIRIGHITFDQHGARVSVRGKTGGRTVRLITSAPMPASWLEQHPFREDAQAPLWVVLAHNSRVKSFSYQKTLNLLSELAKKTRLGKRIYPHLFRHSAATRDSRYLTDRELTYKYGWLGDSKMPARYSHLSGREVDDKLVSVYSGKTIKNRTRIRSNLVLSMRRKQHPGREILRSLRHPSAAE